MSFKRSIVIVSIILFIFSSLMIYIYGRRAKVEVNTENMENITINYDKEIIKCINNISEDKVSIDIFPVKEGSSSIIIEGDTLNEENEIQRNKIVRKIYVHRFGIITKGAFLGYCDGDKSFIISFYIVMVMILCYMINLYRKNTKIELYSYKNVRILGMIFFISISLAINLIFTIYDFKYNSHTSIDGLIEAIKNSIPIFIILVLPLASILTILVTISNTVLLKKEGKSWKNMLGIILGGFICLSTIFAILGDAVSTDSTSTNYAIKEFFYNVIFLYIAYLECILFGTIASGYKSARRIPKFDKDYIIILGCQIKSDGTMLPLLKARVDRAIEFAKMQKEKTGKDIKFVPSGGQGRDEIISEAEAMKRYLLEQGIDKNNILIEDKSTNTNENIKFSNKIIKKENKKAVIAFSTTNYHVFRAGIIANEQKMNIEGIGAKTKSYYWINAFIREFIATLVSEKRTHLKILLELMLILLVFAVVSYIMYSL